MPLVSFADGISETLSRAITPMRLVRIPEPFDGPDWIFEPKMDGFRALAHIAGVAAPSSRETATNSNPGRSSDARRSRDHWAVRDLGWRDLLHGS